MNMNKEQFLKALNKEGLLIYGTTWLENFKRLQELKKYKEMWGDLGDKYYDSVGGLMSVVRQRYFPERNKRVAFLEIELERYTDYLGLEIDTLIALRKSLNTILPEGVKLEGKITIKPRE